MSKEDIKMQMILHKKGFKIKSRYPLGTVCVKDDYMVFYSDAFHKWCFADLTIPIGYLPTVFSCGEIGEMVAELQRRGIIT